MAWFDYMKGFFSNPPNEDKNEDVEDLLEVLKSLTEDLLFSSNKDYPFEVFSWKLETENLTVENIATYIKVAPDTKIETFKIVKVLHAMAKSRRYYSTERREKANRFKQLISFFETQVAEATAFKVGDTEKTVYILGKVSEDYIIGVKTISVES